MLSQGKKLAQSNPSIKSANTVSTEVVSQSRYLTMDEAYNRRDTDGYYDHHMSDWRFIDSNGATDNLRQAKK